MEGSDRTCEDTEDTTTLVQIEDLKCVIRNLLYAQNRRNVKSGLATINRPLAQTRVVYCITHVLVWLGGFHIGAVGTLF